MQASNANRAKKMDYRRKIVMLESDLHKWERTAANSDMEMRRMMRKKQTLEAGIKDLEKTQKKSKNELRMIAVELRQVKKQLDRIS